MRELVGITPQRLFDASFGTRRWVVVFMFASLHLALMGGLWDPLGRALLVTHFGFFLLWQPFFNPERKIGPLAVALLAAGSIGVMFVVTAWILVLWLAVLVGILGGKVFTARVQRLGLFYLIALGYVLMLLLLWVVPRLVVSDAAVPVGIDWMMRFGLPVLLLVMALLPLPADASDAPQGTDFFYSLLFFQLAVLLVLGSLASMNYTGREYFTALLFTILVASGALFVLGMVWNPYAGFAGLRTYLSRYLLSIGLPFEGWLQQLAWIAERESDPGHFIADAATQLTRLPWVTGGTWHAPEGDGEFGTRTAFSSTFESPDLRLVLYTKLKLSPAILIHTRLLTQLLTEFYVAKRREQQLKQNAYMQAVHETGARLTHDIKNLLQSLYSLSAAGQLLGPHESDAYLQMVQRQLPQLSKRLQFTLDKLQAPVQQGSGVVSPVSEWWDHLKAHYAGRDIVFDFDGQPTEHYPVPRNLFDSVAENLLENARRKRIREPSVAIRAHLTVGDTVRFSVTDTGRPVPEAVMKRLFQQPVSGESGMGIGLYQAFRQAQQGGYKLVLSRNEPGEVTFVLQGEPQQHVSAASERVIGTS